MSAEWRIVIVGAGPAGLTAALAAKHIRIERVDIRLQATRS